MSSSYRSNRLGLSHWDPYAVLRGSCLVWNGFKPDLDDQNGFLKCFDTVGLVIWPVQIVPEMTYNVLSGTLNTNQPTFVFPIVSLKIFVKGAYLALILSDCVRSNLM